MPAPFCTVFASIYCSGVDYAIFGAFGKICIQFGANLAPKLNKFNAEKYLLAPKHQKMPD